MQTGKQLNKTPPKQINRQNPGLLNPVLNLEFYLIEVHNNDT